MAKQPVGVWGIDLGQCALKALRLEERDGQVVATAFDYVEHPKILSQPDADPDQLTREALEKFLSRNQLKGDVVAISVPGQSGLARFVKLPPVEEKKIGDIVRFEAKQQIPFNLDEVVWDYQKVGQGMVTDGFALDTEIGLFAMKRDMVNRYLQHFKDVKVDVHVVQMAPLALCNYVSYDLLKKGVGDEASEAGGGKKNCVVALDVGTDSSNLVITDGGRIIWQRPIPLGGNHFTRALTKDLKLTFAKAEHLKRNATKSPDLKRILASIKPVLTDFVSEVQRSLGYFTNTHRDAQIEYMVGLGNAFRLPGLQRFMSEKLQLDVRKVAKLERLGGDDVVGAAAFNENVLSFAVAYGLAVQGLKQARLLTNLLPPEIRVERLIKAKKPWAAAAAAALLLAIGGMTLGYALEYSAYGGSSYDDFKKDKSKVSGKFGDALKKGDGVRAAVQKADSDFKSIQDATNKEKDGINSIAGGQKEQINWLELTKFIDEVIPRPEDVHNPQTLPKEARAYVEEGKVALDRWMAWRGSGAGQSDDLGDGIDRLVQFNIEAVTCRYSDKLSDVWTRITRDLKDIETKVRPVADARKGPGESEKGWVIELRGYTYHDRGTRFVTEVLMERIAQWGEKKPMGWPLQATPAAGDAGAPAPAPAPAAPATPPAEGEAPARAISHVVLYDEESPKAVPGTPYAIIGQSSLPTLVGGGAGGGGAGFAGGAAGDGPPRGPMMSPPGMGMGGAMGGPPMPSGPGGPGGAGFGGTNWAPLGSELIAPIGATAGSGPRPPGMGGGVPEVTAPPMVTPTGQTSRYKRTEFVILFFWREPTPSDSLLKAKPPPSEAGPGMMGPPGGGGGPAPPMPPGGMGGLNPRSPDI